MYSLLATHETRQQKQQHGRHHVVVVTKTEKFHPDLSMLKRSITSPSEQHQQEATSKFTASPPKTAVVNRKTVQWALDCCTTASEDKHAPAIPEHDSHKREEELGGLLGIAPRKRNSFRSPSSPPDHTGSSTTTSTTMTTTFPTEIEIPCPTTTGPPGSSDTNYVSRPPIRSILRRRPKIQKARYLPDPDEFSDHGRFFESDDVSSIETPIDDQYITKVRTPAAIITNTTQRRSSWDVVDDDDDEKLERNAHETVVHQQQFLLGPPPSSCSVSTESEPSWMVWVTPEVMPPRSSRPPSTSSNTTTSTTNHGRPLVSCLRCCADDTGERPEKPFRPQILWLAEGQAEI